jgi:hypothetical protein
MKIRILLVLASLLFAACVGTPFKWDTARQIKTGMSKGEVTAIMGKPYTISSGSDGNEIWAWNYGTALGTGGAYQIVIKGDKVIEVPVISPNL